MSEEGKQLALFLNIDFVILLLFSDSFFMLGLFKAFRLLFLRLASCEVLCFFFLLFDNFTNLLLLPPVGVVTVVDNVFFLDLLRFFNSEFGVLGLFCCFSTFEDMFWLLVFKPVPILLLPGPHGLADELTLLL